MIGWFVVPYKRGTHPDPERVIRYCAIDDYTDMIRADGGDWSEAEIHENRAIVKVRASRETLDMLAAKFERVTKQDAAQLIRENPRRKPRIEDDQFVFDGPVQPTKSIGRLDRRVADD